MLEKSVHLSSEDTPQRFSDGQGGRLKEVFEGMPWCVPFQSVDYNRADFDEAFQYELDYLDWLISKKVRYLRHPSVTMSQKIRYFDYFHRVLSTFPDATQLIGSEALNMGVEALKIFVEQQNTEGSWEKSSYENDDEEIRKYASQLDNVNDSKVNDKVTISTYGPSVSTYYIIYVPIVHVLTHLYPTILRPK